MWVAMGVLSAFASPERCDGADNDGDGLVDEPPLVFGVDNDADGSPSSSDVLLTPDCAAPVGRIPGADDCDDSDSSIYPGAPEVCNGRDDDCDGLIDESIACACETSVSAGSAWQRCADDGLDQPSAQLACEAQGAHLADIRDEQTQDAAAALLTPFQTDFWLSGSDLDAEGTWRWSDGSLFGFTYWRDGQPDDGGASYQTEDCLEMVSTGRWNDRPCEVFLPYLCQRECEDLFFPDSDADGLGDPSSAVTACATPENHVANALDCDDADSDKPTAVYPDLDGDGFGDVSSGFASCDTIGGVLVPGDCNDTDPQAHPGAYDAPGDAIDSDCDGADGEQTQIETPPTAGPTETTTGAPPSPEPSAEADPKAPSAPAPPFGFGCGCNGAARTSPIRFACFATLILLARRNRR